MHGWPSEVQVTRAERLRDEVAVTFSTGETFLFGGEFLYGVRYLDGNRSVDEAASEMAWEVPRRPRGRAAAPLAKVKLSLRTLLRALR